MIYLNLLGLILSAYLAGVQQAYRGSSVYNGWEHYFWVCFAALNWAVVASALWGTA